MKIKYNKERLLMANYSVRVTRDKPYGKLTERDWKKIEDEAMESIFQLMKKHIKVYQMSDPSERTSVIEYDLNVSDAKVYSNKEYKTDLGLQYH